MIQNEKQSSRVGTTQQTYQMLKHSYPSRALRHILCVVGCGTQDGHTVLLTSASPRSTGAGRRIIHERELLVCVSSATEHARANQ